MKPNDRLLISSKRGSLQLWQFLLRLLETPDENSSIIEWTKKSAAEFKLLNPEQVAHLWGVQKNRLSMNYDKLSRSLRYYYEKGIMSKVAGERYVYRFTNYADLFQVCPHLAELNKIKQENNEPKIKLKNSCSLNLTPKVVSKLKTLSRPLKSTFTRYSPYNNSSKQQSHNISRTDSAFDYSSNYYLKNTNFSQSFASYYNQNDIESPKPDTNAQTSLKNEQQTSTPTYFDYYKSYNQYYTQYNYDDQYAYYNNSYSNSYSYSHSSYDNNASNNESTANQTAYSNWNASNYYSTPLSLSPSSSSSLSSSSNSSLSEPSSNATNYNSSVNCLYLNNQSFASQNSASNNNNNSYY